MLKILSTLLAWYFLKTICISFKWFQQKIIQIIPNFKDTNPQKQCVLTLRLNNFKINLCHSLHTKLHAPREGPSKSKNIFSNIRSKTPRPNNWLINDIFEYQGKIIGKYLTSMFFFSWALLLLSGYYSAVFTIYVYVSADIYRSIEAYLLILEIIHCCWEAIGSTFLA